MKRRRASAGSIPPAKIARRMGNLRLYDSEESNEMEGVEGEHFTYLDRNEFNNELNDVEIDDRFLRIPRQLITKNDKAAALALIPYKPPSERHGVQTSK